jgi:signal transduction histidine kinase
MVAGAADYVLKDRLARLGPSVRRALQERRRRAASRDSVAPRGLPAQLLEAQNADRRRVARELHDRVAQTLTAISLGLNLLERLSGIEAVSTAEETIDSCVTVVDRGIRQVRTMMLLLSSQLEEGVGLRAGLGEYLGRFERCTGIPAVFDNSSTPRERWPDWVEALAFRFVQEALSNVHRHSRATEARIRLEDGPASLRVQVADDGVGFPVATNGAGAAGMRERFRLLGGELTIRSHPKGASVQLTIPVHEQN